MPTTPTIETRRRKRIALMTCDASLAAAVEAAAPDDWEVERASSLDAFGDWHELLLFRFLVLDLDEIEAFDPLDVINIIRREYQINLPVLCFGGGEDLRDEMRLSRADRFFERDQIHESLPGFFAAYDW
ncbi:MAG: hypothetical protein ACK4IT_09470 [Thioalkalivibrionaceae bacterium]